jgi:hypothetical protein
MSEAKHTTASMEISLRIGQHVRHRDYKGKRVTGVVRGLSVDSEDVLHADIALDEPIVIPPLDAEDRELPIYRQHVPAHELAPFDEREELIEELTKALKLCAAVCAGETTTKSGLIDALEKARAALHRATGEGESNG